MTTSFPIDLSFQNVGSLHTSSSADPLAVTAFDSEPFDFGTNELSYGKISIIIDGYTDSRRIRQKQSSQRNRLSRPKVRTKSFRKSTKPTESVNNAKLTLCPKYLKETSSEIDLETYQLCGNDQTGNLPLLDRINGNEARHASTTGQNTANQLTQVQETVEKPQKGKLLLGESNGLSVPAKQTQTLCQPKEPVGGFITDERADENDDADDVNKINVVDTIIDLECGITPECSKTLETRHSPDSSNKTTLTSEDAFTDDLCDIVLDSELFVDFDQQTDNGPENPIESDDDLSDRCVLDEDTNSNSQATVIGGKSSPIDKHIDPLEASHCENSDEDWVFKTIVKDAMPDPGYTKTPQSRHYPVLIDNTPLTPKGVFAVDFGDIIFFGDDTLGYLEEQADNRPEKANDSEDASIKTNVIDEDTNSDSSIFGDNPSLTDEDKNFTGAADPDKSDSTVSLNYADLVNFKAEMGRIIEDSSRTKSIMPIVKQELLYKVQCERLARGEQELFLEPEKPKRYKLTEAEIRKKNDRKEQNRRSAKKSRVNSRQRELMLEEIVNTKSVENEKLEKEKQQLLREKADLTSRIHEHLAYCSNNNL